MNCPPHSRNQRRTLRAFTLLEVMLAILMFGLVMGAIYTIWLAILKGTKVSQEAAANVQRSRIALRALEDSLLTAQSFVVNLPWYSFVADRESMSLVARLPASFPGVGRYGDQVVRRVSFFLQSGKDGMNELVMTQSPMLLDLRDGQIEPYTIVLAKDVSLFELQYWDAQKKDWVEEWVGMQTNTLPRLVQITLGLGKTTAAGSQAQDITARIVAVAGAPVGPDLQTMFTPPPGLTNRPGPQVPGQPPAYGPGQPGYPGGVPPAGPYGPGYDRRSNPQRNLPFGR